MLNSREAPAPYDRLAPLARAARVALGAELLARRAPRRLLARVVGRVLVHRRPVDRRDEQLRQPVPAPRSPPRPRDDVRRDSDTVGPYARETWWWREGIDWFPGPMDGDTSQGAPADGRRSRVLALPMWAAVPLLAGVPLLLAARAHVRHARRLRRAAAGQCARCGYDLRASPARCPECGATSTA